MWHLLQIDTDPGSFQSGSRNDLHDFRHGIEDTGMAVREVRLPALTPRPAGFRVIRKPEELPRRLPLLYAQLTRQ